MPRLEVGQRVFIPGLYSKDKIQEATVTKVGRKYFQIDKGQRWLRFHVDTMYSDSTVKYRCYLSMEEIKEEEERYRLLRHLRETFDPVSGSGKGLPLISLRAINSIIEAHK